MPETVTKLHKNSPHNFALDIPYGTLKLLNNVISKFPSTDEARPVLTCVHVTTNVLGRLRFEATDSHRLVQLDSNISCDNEQLDITIPWSWVQRVMPSMIHRRSPVELNVAERGITMRNGDETFTIMHSQGDPYPSFDNIIGEVPENPNLDPCAFKPAYLRDLGNLLLDATHVQLWVMKDLRPMIVKFHHGPLDSSGIAALMPIRVP